MQSQDSTVSKELSQIDAALRANAIVALDMAKAFTAAHPQNFDGWIFSGRAHQTRAQFRDMLAAAERATAIDPANPLGRLLMMEALFRCGKSELAFEAARKLEAQYKYDAVIIDQLASFYTQTNRYAEASQCYERLRVLQPTNTLVSYSLATTYAALGELDKTERLFDSILRKAPHGYDAYFNRSTLRKQTAAKNHVDEMEKLLNGPLLSPTAEPILCYSLAKELEDLGEWARSFNYLKRGADARRRGMTYDVKDDLALCDEIESHFDAGFFAENRPGYDKQSPFFVLGMPRSGTTLVDRILSSHSAVGSVGESSEFTVASIRQCSRKNASTMVAFDQARRFDYEMLGREYSQALDGLLPGYAHVLDKTPTNFFHLGMIAVALPNAPIVHLRRNPVANCYAMYKALFRSGYSFSYTLEELGQYYLGYLKLMEHWRRVLPGRFLDVDYEDLVANQETVSRGMIAYCGLDWEDSCLAFEKNTSPSLTASVAQVRQPIYKTSLDMWRNYETQLAPLVRFFEANGVAVNEP